MKGILTIVSGFSGVGKGTVVNRMKEMHPFTLSISATTRSPRRTETEGVNYYFISQEEFDRRIQEGYFLEWAKYTSGSYGTPKQPVLDALDRGEDVLLEIEAHGARQVKEQYPEALLIYMMPPSFAELANRLTSRGTEKPEAIQARLLKTLEEFRAIREYDAIVVNMEVEDCALEILNLIKTRRLSPDAQEEFLTALEEEARAMLNA